MKQDVDMIDSSAQNGQNQNDIILNIVKELKDMNESDMEGIMNLAKENMMTNVYDILDSVDVTKG